MENLIQHPSAIPFSLPTAAARVKQTVLLYVRAPIVEDKRQPMAGQLPADERGCWACDASGGGDTRRVCKPGSYQGLDLTTAAATAGRSRPAASVPPLPTREVPDAGMHQTQEVSAAVEARRSREDRPAADKSWGAAPTISGLRIISLPSFIDQDTIVSHPSGRISFDRQRLGITRQQAKTRIAAL